MFFLLNLTIPRRLSNLSYFAKGRVSPPQVLLTEATTRISHTTLIHHVVILPVPATIRATHAVALSVLFAHFLCEFANSLESFFGHLHRLIELIGVRFATISTDLCGPSSPLKIQISNSSSPQTSFRKSRRRQKSMQTASSASRTARRSPSAT